MRTGKFVTPEINLLPEDDLTEKSGGRFLKWALSWGKKIVVLTELFVVIAFLSRFKLDSDVANYSEEIDRRKVIIQASANFEKEFRSVQTRINDVKKLEALPKVVTIYDLVQTLIPENVNVQKTHILETKVQLEGSGLDQDLSTMVAAFKTSRDFTDVNVEKFTKVGASTAIDFSLTATYLKKS